MNWQYIKNTSPNYWRYQGAIILIVILSYVFNIVALFNEPELENLPIAQLGVYGVIALSIYQIATQFITFHIVLRGIYKHFKTKATTKLKLFLLLFCASIVCSIIIIVLDLLPIVVSLVPYSMEEYLTEMMHQVSIKSALIVHFFSITASILAWAYLYVLFASISNYKQLSLLLKKQELQILTNRINPEFLFDTMQAIKRQIDIDEEKAADLVTKASDLFRYNLMSSKTPEANLIDEVKSLENYLELLEMQQRAPSSSIYKLYEQEQAPTIPSMSLIFICLFLQNTARKPQGKLSISGFVKQQKYRLEISHQSSGKFFLDTEHFDNVKARLEHLYNTNANILLVSRGRHRRVIIELPFEWQPQCDQGTQPLIL